jgi:cob(I)alamin adenosyltransferase
MNIYTRKGDGGQTSLIGGTRVPKHHLRVEAYGMVDELNAWIGMVLDGELPDAQRTVLGAVQDRLFTVGAHLASDPDSSRMVLPDLEDGDTDALERAIDAMEADLPELKNFVLPGGHPAVSRTHVARCVCRRAERAVVRLSEAESVDGRVTAYLNRLSDYLFVLSRAVAQAAGAQEIPWKPRG